MKGYRFFLFIITALILGSCENIEKKHEKLLAKIADENGEILYDGYKEKSLGEIIYVTDEDLYRYNPTTDSTDLMYDSSDTLTFHSFKINPDNPLEILHTQNTRIGLPPDPSLLSAKQRFNMTWPWIQIDKEYMSNTFHPEIIFDLRDFNLDDDVYVHDSSTGMFRSSKSCISPDHSINLAFVEDQSQLPGFSSYTPSTINQYLWENEGYLDPTLKEYFPIFEEAEVSTDELIFKFDEENVYHIPFKIGVDSNIEIANVIIWNNDTLSNKVTSEDMYPLYVEREKRIDAEFRDFRIGKMHKAESLNEKNQERRIEELKAIAEEERARQQAALDWQIKNAVHISEIKGAYLSNAMKARRDYPVNSYMVVKARLLNIKHASNYKYIICADDSYIDPIYIYANQDIFANFSYPVDVCLKVYFKGIITNNNAFDPIEHEFIFIADELLEYY